MTTPDLRRGLSESEVTQRINAGDVNIVHDRTSRSIWSIVRQNVFTLFNGILTAAVILILIFGDIRDTVFAGVMIVNSVIGVFSEWRAKRTLDALAIVDAPTATVRRAGTLHEIPVNELVVDDVIELSLGDQVSVDGTVESVSGLEIDESMLTGESRPVKKAVGDTILAGTSVVAGAGIMRATTVGEHTYAQGLSRAARVFVRTRSEIQESINKVLRVISALLLPIVALTLWSQTRIAGEVGSDWRHAIVLAVASVVGMIPQGLVLLTSLNFAIGSAKLARKSVLVQELAAVEVLARVDSLCLDKTGTLTTGKIRVKEIIPITCAQDDAPDLQALHEALALLSADRTNATACAIDSYVSALGVGEKKISADSLSTVIPFSSARKWSGVFSDGHFWMLGAPEILGATDSSQSSSDVLDQANAYAQSGVRVVALAHCGESPREEELPNGRDIVALVLLEEDLRSDAAQTLDYFRGQGVHVRMISGDNPQTVSALATQAGLRGPNGQEPRAIDARTLPTDLMSDEFMHEVLTHDVFGRVTPEQKRAMVQVLQAAGHCVAMTGDGVNDALALKDADLGIAMGNGARATKAVAQIVLVNSEFSQLPGVLAQGRRIIANMERVSALFLSKTCYAAVLVLVCALAAWPFPFLPRHYTYIGALTIGVPSFFIALGPNLRRYVPGFLRRTLSLAIPSGIILSATALTAYGFVGIGTVAGQSAATLTLLFGALWLLSITARPFVTWRIALLALMACGAVLGIFIPPVRAFFALEWPTTSQWFIIATCGALACFLIECSHRLYHHRALRQAEERGRADTL
ncbi:HAD-IC family P-type ATPase [Schaalia sp. ZJ405]|uniref:HAD-IC family P-type ATPase n=1 Tax=Schaalia sp. ZJ405 TaxID=2709403 RepID=UPI0013E9C9D0|nr:HAD-IC family P-type ATPase [Schaalia sp. ZJ405]QPK80488.1 HAD-IC family P-type ATPase [Schaalia sp. ZJ405]